MYFPDDCGDPESGVDCGQGLKMLHVERVLFEADVVPEPASVLLLGSGLFALVRRCYRRRP